MTQYKAQSNFLFNPTSATYTKPNKDSIAVDKVKIYTEDSPSGYITIKPRKKVTKKQTEVINDVEHPTETKDEVMYELDELPEGYKKLVSEINNRDVRISATILEIINEDSQNYMVIQPDHKHKISLHDPEDIENGDFETTGLEAEDPEDFKESENSEDENKEVIF